MIQFFSSLDFLIFAKQIRQQSSQILFNSIIKTALFSALASTNCFNQTHVCCVARLFNHLNIIFTPNKSVSSPQRFLTMFIMQSQLFPLTLFSLIYFGARLVQKESVRRVKKRPRHSNENRAGKNCSNRKQNNESINCVFVAADRTAEEFYANRKITFHEGFCTFRTQTWSSRSR